MPFQPGLATDLNPMLREVLTVVGFSWGFVTDAEPADASAWRLVTPPADRQEGRHSRQPPARRLERRAQL